MTQDMIGRLLHAGLMTGLGDDPERAGWLRSAATELSAELHGSELVPSAVMASCDSSVSANAPPIAATEDRVRAQWETFRNAHPGGEAAALLRAVTLHALFLAAEHKPETGAALWYLFRNVADTAPEDRFSEVVAEAVRSLDMDVAGQAETLWTTASSHRDLRMPDVTAPEGTEVSRGTATRLSKAFPEIPVNGPQQLRDGLKQPLVNAVSGLAAAVETAMAEDGERQREMVRGFSRELGVRLRRILDEQEQLIAAAALRDRLLWWRLAGRSPSLGNRRYDEVDPATRCVAAALDLASLVPELTPVAVEHLLADVVHGDDGHVDVTIDEVRSASEERGGFEIVSISEARAPAILVDVVIGGVDDDRLPESLAGSRSNVELSVLLFREVQALRLLAESEE